MAIGLLPVISALAGSLIGGITTLTASLITQQRQLRGQALIQESMKREPLYAEFIKEASRRRAEAWSHQAESPEVIAGLYSAVERMRLFSSSEVIRQAEQVIRHVIEAYAAPDKTFDELRQNMDAAVSHDPIKTARDHRRWSPFSSKAVTRFHRRRPPIFMKVATSKSSQQGTRGD